MDKTKRIYKSFSYLLTVNIKKKVKKKKIKLKVDVIHHQDVEFL